MSFVRRLARKRGATSSLDTEDGVTNDDGKKRGRITRSMSSSLVVLKHNYSNGEQSVVTNTTTTTDVDKKSTSRRKKANTTTTTTTTTTTSSELTTTISIMDLSDSLMLEVFQHLDTYSLLSVARVCKRWNNVTRHNSLWKNFILDGQKVTLRKLWNLARSHFSHTLESIHIQGCAGITKNNSKPSLSDSLLNYIRRKCPNLKSIKLYSSVISEQYLMATSFPPELNSLELINCSIPKCWFQRTLQTNALRNIRVLNLSHCHTISQVDLAAICYQCQKLEVLNLNHNYRGVDSTYRAISQTLHELRELHLSRNIPLTDCGLELIARNLRKLTVLDISNCTKVTDTGLSSVFHLLINLEVLILARCPGITTDCLHCVKSIYENNQRCLRRLVLPLTEKIPGNCVDIDDIRTLLPHCVIIQE